MGNCRWSKIARAWTLIVVLFASRTSLSYQLDALYTQLKTNQSEQHELREMQVGIIMTTNGEIDVTTQYEENERTINEIYLQTIAQEVYELDEGQRSLLEGIIYQCPLMGGNAVYKARSVYAMYDPTLAYNDFAACEAANIPWRIKNPTIGTSLQQLALYPNPAKDKVTVVFNAAYLGSILSICNTLGQVVLKTALVSETGKQEILINGLPKGVYYVYSVRYPNETVKLMVD